MSTESPTPEHPRPKHPRVVPPNFITDIIDSDLAAHRVAGHGVARVVTRWPPEPNGYIHIGHAKSICLNFGLAQDYGGRCSLRFDDTNPTTEDMEYVEAIQRDIRWLGFDWDEHLYFASDYFDTLYRHAVMLVERGLAYVDSLSESEIRAYRGTITEAGRNSPYRERAVTENLDLLARMRAGEFAEGAHVLRAKIDMSHPNMVMRDPLIYRIRHAHHYRTGNAWHIYPLYDFAHGLSDAIEGVTHSLCTLEFETRRELYDWFVGHLYSPPRPHQYEFGRHNIEYTVLGKRNLVKLVKEGYVDGWDDPRLPTLAGLRRRGVTPTAIRDFVNRIGVSKQNSSASIALLEHSVRDDLNLQAPRVMGVLRPLKVVIDNYPEAQEEWLEASYYPHDVPKQGSRKVPFSRELYIEQDDFAEDPPKGFYRLTPGGEVRLRYGYVIRCDKVIRDQSGTVTELRCSYDPDTLGQDPRDGRKVRGIIHWLSARHALNAEVRLYDRLFTVPVPEGGEKPFTDYLNPDSLVTLTESRVEPSVQSDPADTRYQFERQGYFIRDSIWDSQDTTGERLVFNRIVPLRDSWAKTAQAKTVQENVTLTESASVENVKPPETSRKAIRPPAASGTPRDPMLDFSLEQKTRHARYTGLGLSSEDAALIVGHPDLIHFFEDALKAHDNPQGIANWIVNDLWRERKHTPLDTLPVTPGSLAQLVALVDDTTISGRIAKDVFAVMLDQGGSPRDIVAARGLTQLSDTGELEPIVDRLVTDNPDKVAAYREGKVGLLGFFVGQVMRETGGKANPQLVQALVKGRLE